VKILIAEDDPITRRLLQDHLTKWGHETVVCSDGSQAWQVLQRDDAPKLVILDWMMPEMDGPTICRELRNLEKQSYIYVILLTARNLKEDIIEGLESGADDYIIKPFDAHELRVRVRAGSRIVNLQDDLRSALSDAEFKASHDGLTDLWNRRAILEIVQKEMARSVREHAPLGLVMGDLDHFKQINDSHGHLAGDMVLCEVARRMVSSLRPYDSAGRYGGEEFILILPGCDTQASAEIAERLRLLLRSDPVKTNEGDVPVMMSFGVATMRGTEDCWVDSIVRAADEALYRAKEEGRDRVVVADKIVEDRFDNSAHREGVP
jgi:two-component system, cell cycle response regulator